MGAFAENRNNSLAYWAAVFLLGAGIMAGSVQVARAATPYAYYPMDESSWTAGTSGQVVDTSGNGRNATPTGIAQTAPGKVCRAGDFLNTSDARTARSAVRAPFAITGAWSSQGAVDFWYDPTSSLNNGKYPILLSGGAWDAAQGQQGQYDPDMLVIAPPYLVFWFTDAAGNQYQAFFRYSSLSGWNHVALSFNLKKKRRRGRYFGSVKVYLDGASISGGVVYDGGNGQWYGAGKFPNAGSLLSQSNPLMIGDLQGSVAWSSGESAVGKIDEWRLYSTSISAAQVSKDMNATHACASGGLGSLTVASASTASTCTNLPLAVTITALDARGNVLKNYSGTVALSDSSGHGNWSRPSAAYGTLTPGPADSGSASYTFSPRDQGSVTLDLVDNHADDLTVQARAGAVVGSSSLVSFRDNLFVIAPVNPLAPAYPDVVTAGRPESFSATLYDKDPSTGLCNVATQYQGAKALYAWYAPSANDPAGALPPGIGGTGIGASKPAAPNVTMNFTSGVASFALSTQDVGQYSIDLEDDSGFAKTRAGAPRPIGGSSAVLTVVPASLAITGIQTPGGTANPASTAPTGAVFTGAGDPFDATVSGELWGGSGVTPHFAWQTSLAAQSPFLPSGGTLGSLTMAGASPVSIGAPSYSGGSTTATGLGYSEVGSFTLGASVSGYLGTAGADVSGSAVAGRFTPAWFITSVTPGCGSAFTYSGQPFTVTVDALNTAGRPTVNYDGGLGWSKEVTLSDAAAPKSPPGVFSVSGRYIAPASFSGGVATDSSVVYTFLRPDTLPYDLTIRADDQDLVSSAGHAQGSTKIVSGRASIHSANGSELMPLDLPIFVQGYMPLPGSSTQGWWAPNKQDTCTNPSASDFSISGWTGALTTGSTSVSSATLSSGSGYVALAAPGQGKVGSALVTWNAPAWLRYPWNGGAAPADPSALAAFGFFKGAKPIIYQNEVY